MKLKHAPNLLILHRQVITGLKLSLYFNMTKHHYLTVHIDCKCLRRNSTFNTSFKNCFFQLSGVSWLLVFFNFSLWRSCSSVQQVLTMFIVFYIVLWVFFNISVTLTMYVVISWCTWAYMCICNYASSRIAGSIFVYISSFCLAWPAILVLCFPVNYLTNNFRSWPCFFKIDEFKTTSRKFILGLIHLGKTAPDTKNVHAVFLSVWSYKNRMQIFAGNFS